MKKNIYLGIGTLVLAGLLAFNVFITKNNQNNIISLSYFLSVQQAQAENGAGGGNGVNCRCGLIWGTGCRANNHGCQCGPEGTEFCWIYDSNCG